MNTKTKAAIFDWLLDQHLTVHVARPGIGNGWDFYRFGNYTTSKRVRETLLFAMKNDKATAAPSNPVQGSSSTEKA